ncbi:N-acetyl-gamma-glutamyl-phosphate reductase, common form [Singulisphaera sp. GP187]|nr:N-acetyl-gamma-glutamyl-phosphate reductase, common form [Singulisphaera sp. GP187]
MKTGVAIVGASGYASRELIRILLNHPGAEIRVATSRQDESPRVDALHPSLAGRIDLACEPFDADRLAERARVAFLALPHTASMAVVASLRERDVRVIDLSADYRLTDAQVYADWYGHPHTDSAGLKEAVYGLPELYRASIPPAGLIANPGCYTSTSILALAPLIRENLVERTGIVIDAKSGVSGAGRSPKLSTHYPNATRVFPPTASASTATHPRSTRSSAMSAAPRVIRSKSSSPRTWSRWIAVSSPRSTRPPEGQSSSTTCSTSIGRSTSKARSSGS